MNNSARSILLLVSGRMYGGGQRVVFDVLEESRKLPNGTTNVCFLGGPVPSMPPFRGVVVEYDGRYNRPITLWQTSRRLRKVVEGLKPDLVHSHGWDAAMIGALGLLGLPVSHLIHIHTTDVWLDSKKLKHRMRRSLTRWMFTRPATTVVAVSDAVRRHWARALECPAELIRVIRNGVDTGRFQPPSIARMPDGVVTLGVAARLEPNKGLEELLCALAILAENNLYPNLVIAGDGKLRGALELSIEQLGLRQQVEFLGFVGEMDRFYQSTDVAVLPSRTEGLPLVVLEAMSCGVPVVATDVGGVREVLRHGIDGFIVPPREPTALAEALRRLLQNSKDRQEMGMNARRRILADFSRTLFIDKVSNLYEDVLAQSKRVYPKGSRSIEAQEII